MDNLDLGGELPFRGASRDAASNAEVRGPLNPGKTRAELPPAVGDCSLIPARCAKLASRRRISVALAAAAAASGPAAAVDGAGGGGCGSSSGKVSGFYNPGFSFNNLNWLGLSYWIEILE